jgi:hypothetical protein
VTGQRDGETPEVSRWPDEQVYSPFPDNSLSKELQADIAEVLGSHNAARDSRRIQELVRPCRSTTRRYEAHGHHDEAQKWRNDANRLSEAARLSQNWQTRCAPTSKKPQLTPGLNRLGTGSPRARV